MKGTIVNCLEEMVTQQFGAPAWKAVLESAGLNSSTIFLVFQDVDDAVVMTLLAMLCQRLHLSLEQLAERFGDYWVNVYSQKTYLQYYTKHATAQDFILGLDAIHVAMTKTMPNARPPRFEYTWQDEQTLLMKYHSHRNLLDLAIGLVKGVGKFYRQQLEVTKLSTDTLQIIFRS